MRRGIWLLCGWLLLGATAPGPSPSQFMFVAAYPARGLSISGTENWGRPQVL
jgi:hypothetical protein